MKLARKIIRWITYLIILVQVALLPFILQAGLWALLPLAALVFLGSWLELKLIQCTEEMDQ